MEAFTEDQIKLIQQGNQVVYKKLFELYYNRLVVFANKYTNDAMVAEDLVVDLFKHLWEHRRLLKVEGSLDSFLFSATKNRCLNYLRNQKARARIHDDMVSLSNESVDFSNFMVEEEIHFKIWKAIENLPTECRQVLVLNTVHRVKLPEIAEDLNISINTIKSQKKRALKLLREELGDALFLVLLVSF